MSEEVDATWLLDPGGLLFAYEQGAFPMDVRDDGGRFRLAAYRADPRGVLPLGALRVPRTLRRTLPRHGLALTVDRSFEEVLDGCAARPGLDEDEVWLTPRLIDAYRRLHRWGHAHSYEVRDGERLVGGTFGVAVGRFHTLESMFHRAADAGSAAVLLAALHLRRCGFTLLDVQQRTAHTGRLGVVDRDEASFLEDLRRAVADGIRPPAVAGADAPPPPTVRDLLGRPAEEVDRLT